MCLAIPSKIIEINARFGDPEAMNVLPLLSTDFIDLCMSMIDESLSEKKIKLEKKSTVCKYVVPEGYGVRSMIGEKIIINPKVPDSWNEFKIKLEETDAMDGSTFNLLDWAGIQNGNGELDLDKIKGWAFEVSINGSGNGDFVTGKILFDQIELKGYAGKSLIIFNAGRPLKDKGKQIPIKIIDENHFNLINFHPSGEPETSIGPPQADY